VAIIETVRINIVLPCTFSAALGGLQPSGQSPSACRRRAARSQKATLIGIGSLAVSFGAVQRDRWRGAKRLVSRMAIEACRTLGGFVRLSRVTDRHSADIELLMREVHRFSDDDYDNDNDNDNGCVRCSTWF
jgi:hypothetical protein